MLLSFQTMLFIPQVGKNTTTLCLAWYTILQALKFGAFPLRNYPAQYYFM